MIGTKDYAASYPVMTSPTGRTCVASGCETHLSIYNHGLYCCLHEPIDDMITVESRRAARSGRKGTNPPRYDGTDKACTRCRFIMPRREGFWKADPNCADGLHPWCRGCRREAERERRLRREPVRTDPRYDGSPKTCSKCGEQKPRIRQYWHKDSSSGDGLNGRCIVCRCPALAGETR